MDKNIKFWDSISGNYDKQVEKVFSEAYEKTIRYTKKYLKKTDCILDIGCGTGITTIQLANDVKEIHAVDLSEKMLDRAREKAEVKSINNITFGQEDIFDKKFKYQTYDVIMAFNIVCYIEDDQAFMRRIHDLLKEDGLFISLTDCVGKKENLIYKVQKLLSQIGVMPKINRYAMEDLKHRVGSCGFEIIQSENVHTSLPNYFIVGRKTSL